MAGRLIIRVIEALIKYVLGNAATRALYWSQSWLSSGGRQIAIGILIFSSLLLLSSLSVFFLKINSEVMLILQITARKYLWWGIGAPLTGLLCLIALATRRSGRFYVICIISIVFTLASIVLFSFLGLSLEKMPASDPRVIFFFLFMFTYIIPGTTLSFVALILSYRDPVHPRSKIAKLVYFGRYRHICEVMAIAQKYDWTMHVEDRNSAISFQGIWHDYTIRLESGYNFGYPESYLYLSVSVFVPGTLWPLYTTSFDKSKHAVDWIDLESVVGLHCLDFRGRNRRLLVLAPSRRDAVQANFDALLSAINNGNQFLRKMSILESRFSQLRFDRRDTMRITVNGEEIEHLLLWLIQIVEVMKEHGFYRQPC